MQIMRDFLYETFYSFLNYETLSELLVVITMILFWYLLGLIVSKVTKKTLQKIYQVSKEHIKTPVKHNETLAKMIHTLISYVFWFFIFVLILGELNINVLPVIASAGIIAFAVGFGAQELIKDLISGFFLISERAFDVGDVIEVGSFKGTVSEVGMRRTRLTNWKNELMIINNGDIRALINFSHGLSIALVEFTVSFNTNISVFKDEIFTKQLQDLKSRFPQIVVLPKFDGLIEVKEKGLLIRFTAKTENGKQHEVQRAMASLISAFAIEKEVSLTQAIYLIQE